MGSGVTYRYVAEDRESIDAHPCLTQDVLDGGKPRSACDVGTFRYRDGALLRITLETDGTFRARRLGAPAGASRCCTGWMRTLLYLLRTVLRREGGWCWKVDVNGAEEIRQALRQCRVALDARTAQQLREPGPVVVAPTEASALPSAEEQVRPSGERGLGASADSAVLVVANPVEQARQRDHDPGAAFALAIGVIFPFLSGRDRVSVLTVSATLYQATSETDRQLARALAHAGSLRDLEAFCLALNSALEWRSRKILDGPQHDELLGALALSIRRLPPGHRREAVLRLTSRIAACQQERICVRFALFALAELVHSTPDLQDAGPGLIAPLCRLIPRLRRLEGIATPQGRLKVALALMRQPWKAPGIARGAWRLLVADDHNWLDAIAHLARADQMRVLPGIVGAAMATARRQEEAAQVLRQLGERWHAMVGCVLRLDADHPLKQLALAAVLAAWPLRDRDPEKPQRDLAVWDAAFDLLRHTEPATEAVIAAELVAWLDDLPYYSTNARRESLSAWLMQAELPATVRFELCLALHEEHLFLEQYVPWQQLWTAWRQGRDAHDIGVGRVLARFVASNARSVLRRAIEDAGEGLSDADRRELRETGYVEMEWLRMQHAWRADVLQWPAHPEWLLRLLSGQLTEPPAPADTGQ